MVQTLRFTAMGSPCEVQVDGTDIATGAAVVRLVEAEAQRIEARYSRYRPDSIVSQINAAAGRAVALDAETAGLIDYAAALFAMSAGRFDITSGILRRIWRFDASGSVPTPDAIADLRQHLGWDRVAWDGRSITLPAGMEIDLGGLAKEYAVDTALALAMAAHDVPILVNFGGDLRVSGPRADGSRWRVRIDPIDDDPAAAWLELAGGALTTSGDARRFFVHEGRRYGHILDPRSAMPVEHAPRSVTVAAATCIEAGILSTLAMLHGAEAEAFLQREGVKAWVVR